MQECVRRARDAGVTWPLPPTMNEAALHAVAVLGFFNYTYAEASLCQGVYAKELGIGSARTCARLSILAAHLGRLSRINGVTKAPDNCATILGLIHR